jgi:hypothetical protein
MSARTVLTILYLGLIQTLPAALAAESEDPAVIGAVDHYVVSFNTRSPEAWTASMHFPHVSFGDGQVVSYTSRDAALDVIDIETFARTTGWSRSEIVSSRVLQTDGQKAHVAARIARFNEAGVPYSAFDALFIVERIAGRWGIRAYSRLAVEPPDDS